MGFIQSIMEWNRARMENRASDYRNQGKCPDCYGQGFYPLINEFISPLECTSCNGTGLLSMGSDPLYDRQGE